MKEKAQKKKIHFEILPVLILVATLFMSVAYAQISDVKLEITGTVDAIPQEGVFISDVTKLDTSSEVISEEIKYYKGTTLSTSIELSTSTSSSVIYTISLYNNSGEDYYFKGVSYDETAYDNNNIIFSLDGLAPYLTTIKAREEKSFTIQFKYVDGITVSTNQVLNSLLSFDFSNETIEFKVADTTYTAQKGATWEQFVESEYNTYGFSIIDGNVYTSNGEQIYNLDVEEDSTNVIIEGKTYNYKPELTLDKESIEVEIEEGTTATETLTATLTNIEGELTWISSNIDVAEVVGNGNTATVTIKSAGTAEITVSYENLSATCTVIVTEEIALIIDNGGNNIIGQIVSKNTEAYDEYGNKIVVPKGFMIRVDDTTNKAVHVTEGIVIEDTSGNQFVWIPVGTVYTNQQQTESETIALGRYVFKSNGDIDTSLSKTNPSDILITSSMEDYGYKEDLKDSTNTEIAHARDIEAFIESTDTTKGNGGYYLGRYEARTNNTTGRSAATDELTSMTTIKANAVYNYVTQEQASNLSQGMYADGYKNDGTGTFSSDLINSFAWDTAIVFAQTFDNRTDRTTPYSKQTSLNSNLSITGTTTDVICNIYDMASNCIELSTERYEIVIDPYTTRGGGSEVNDSCSSDTRIKTSTSSVNELGVAFRPIIYVGKCLSPNIALNKESIEVEIEEGETATETLTATLENVDGEPIWTSSNTSVVEISGSGNTRTIIAKKVGIATITVSYGRYSATCSVTVVGMEFGVSADTIANAEYKHQYYGKTVNYTCGDTETSWKIFYAGATPGTTENNIYLIADESIAWDNIGTTLQELLYKNDTYYFSFDNVVLNENYTQGTGSNRFINSPAKNWFKYARSTTIDNGYGYTSSKDSMSAVAMMLDTRVWKNYCNNTYACYAIGGPTLDMFVSSWNQTQELQISFEASSNNSGYIFLGDDGTTLNLISDLQENGLTNNLYNSSIGKVWLSSTADFGIGGVGSLLIRNSEEITYMPPYGSDDASLIGFLPVVCLYSDVKLSSDSTGEYDFVITNSCEHEFINGKCSLCERNCTHSYLQDGICEICSIECAHTYSNGACTICEKACEHNYVDGTCTICGEIDCTHSWDTEGICTLCGTICEHTWTDGKCSVCGYTCTHTEKENNVCKVCGYDTSCITEGTLITLANGEQVAVENLSGEEKLLVWDMLNGCYKEAEIAYIINHNGIKSKCEIIHLYFSDGTDIEIVSDHGFYDLDLNKTVYINATNYEEFVGDYFVTQNLNSKKEWNKAQLTKVEIEYRETRVYEVVTYEHLTCFTNGLLSISSLLNPFCNIFEVDPNTLSYNEELMAKDIEKYGLFTYEDFKDMIPEYAFRLYHVDYLKVALGKGLTTWDEINFLVDFYHREIAPIVRK